MRKRPKTEKFTTNSWGAIHLWLCGFRERVTMTNAQESGDLFTEFFEERAAIREHDGGQFKADAEQAARDETKKHMFRCMVRQLLQWKANDQMLAAIDWISKQPESEQQAWKEASNEQWNLGNRGEAGNWIDDNNEMEDQHG